MKKFSVILTMLFLSNFSFGAENLKNPNIEFSIDIPYGTPINKEGDHRGESISLVFENSDNERIVVQALRANNGGFKEARKVVFSKLIEGLSATFGQPPAFPIRTISYNGKQLFVATHVGVQGMVVETISYFEDRSVWRKLITLHISSNTQAPLSDLEIVEKLSSLNFVPSFLD